MNEGILSKVHYKFRTNEDLGREVWQREVFLAIGENENRPVASMIIFRAGTSSGVMERIKEYAPMLLFSYFSALATAVRLSRF